MTLPYNEANIVNNLPSSSLTNNSTILSKHSRWQPISSSNKTNLSSIFPNILLNNNNSIEMIIKQQQSSTNFQNSTTLPFPGILDFSNIQNILNT